MQQVITHNKAKADMWIEQDEAHKEPHKWVEEANAWHTIEMMEPQPDAPMQELGLGEVVGCQITMNLEKLMPIGSPVQRRDKEIIQVSGTSHRKYREPGIGHREWKSSFNDTG